MIYYFYLCSKSNVNSDEARKVAKNAYGKDVFSKLNCGVHLSTKLSSTDYDTRGVVPIVLC